MNSEEVRDRAPALSPTQLAIRRLKRNRIAIAGAIILAILYFLTIFAGFFSPYSPTEDEFRDYFYHPPTTLHFRDENGSFHLRPYVIQTHLVDRNQILYSAGTPLYIHVELPKANTNPYIPETIQSETPLLTVTDAKGKTIGVAYSMLETERNSGIFAATIPLDPWSLGQNRSLTVRSYTGDSKTFAVGSDQPVDQRATASPIRITDSTGKTISAYSPHIESYPVRFFVRGWKYRFLWVFKSELHFFGVERPGNIFLFGTDQAGRDIFSRVWYGAQISLSIGLLGVFVTTLFGMLYGGIAGYYGGNLDHWMMRFAEVLMSIPALYLILALRNIIPERMQDLYNRIGLFGQQTFAWHDTPVAFWTILLAATLLLSYYVYSTHWKRGPLVFSVLVWIVLAFGPFLTRFFLGFLELLIPGSTQLTSEWTYLLIILMLSAVGWAAMSRVIRGMVLSLREQEYVIAARAIGASDLRVLTKHILPNTIGYVIVRATLLIPAYILGEVALSFLGVGVQEPVASWGNMLSSAQSLRVLQQFTWSLTPGIFLFLTVLAYNFLGDGLRDALDPKTK